MTTSKRVEEIVKQIDEKNIKAGDLHAGLHYACNKCMFAISQEELKEARDAVFAEVRSILTTTLTQLEKHAVEREIGFLKTLYVSAPTMSAEKYSDSNTELECFQDGFDDAKNQIEGKIRDRIKTLTTDNNQK